MEADGFVCIRAGGSLGVFDLACFKSDAICLIQVKTGRPPPPAERERLREFPAPAGVEKLVHIWRDYQRAPDVRRIA